MSDPSHVRRGEKGARTRWGPPRIARLDDLTPAQRDVVVALINTMKAAPVMQTSGAATTEGHGNDRPSS